jgi:UDP:flavonoid glycosyltransferase YjiC (YdhE family)
MKFSSLLSLFFATKLFAVTTPLTKREPLKIAISSTMGSRSHANYLLEITKLLSNRGHSIDYVTSEASLKYSNGYNVSRTVVTDIEFDPNTFEHIPFNRRSSMRSSLYIIKTIADIYDQSFKNFENYYLEQKPDLIICDFFSPNCIDSAAKFSIPMIIGYQSFNFLDPLPYLTISNGLEPASIENYSFLERFLHGILDPVKDFLSKYEFLKHLKQARKNNGVPATLKFTQFTNMGLAIANNYIGFEKSRSLPSHIYPIGPILPESFPALDTDLQSFFDTHQKVLYIAFGSYIKFKGELATNMLEHFQKLLNEGWIDGIIWGGVGSAELKKFPETYTVDSIKYSTEAMLRGTHQQVKLLKWAPQRAILNHPHTKLFITHGGLDSIYEAVESGTPMLVIPHIGDQPRNAALVKEHGVGDYIEWSVDSDDLINQKFATLLDPSNTGLKSKLEQLQVISKFSSNRKLFAADLIESYAYSAKTCRLHQTPKSFETPCEVKPFLPLDQQISFIKANLIDVYSVAILILLAIMGSGYSYVNRNCRKFYKVYNKQNLIK